MVHRRAVSEYETLIARPEWRRENDADLYGAIVERARCRRSATSTREFMQPDQNAVVVAYFQSAVTIEYLAQTYGFPKIVDALKLYGKGKETPEVLQTITGKTIAQLDVDFRKYLDIRLAPYAGTFKLPTRGLRRSSTKLEIAADAAPKDAKARANVALGYYYARRRRQGRGRGARGARARSEAADRALHPRRDRDARRTTSQRRSSSTPALVADGHDSYDLRTRLAQLAEDEHDTAEVEKQLCAAKKLDPERSYPYQALAELYKKQGNAAKQLAELEHYAFIEQMELSPLKELVARLRQARQAGPRSAPTARWRRSSTRRTPTSCMGLARAYLELGDGSQALYTYDTALVANPPPRRPALVQLGRAKAFVALGKPRDAKAAIDLAMKTEPENAEVLELKAKLK